MAARVRMFEYRRPGWTFHGKGLWYTEQAGSPGPCLTMVGSPNFGYRSQKRDLETQVPVTILYERRLYGHIGTKAVKELSLSFIVPREGQEYDIWPSPY